MKLRTLIALMAVCIITAFVAPAFSQEMPAPGTVIDKNNFKKYAHLFPEEFAPAFLDGFGGVTQPVKVKVSSPSPTVGQPKSYLALSAKNKGKYALDAQGDIANFKRGVGLPFPDLDKNDKDFINKLMWNYDNRYKTDDNEDDGIAGSWEKRRGEPVRYNNGRTQQIFYANRLGADPKPNLPNPIGLFTSLVLQYYRPESVRNTIMLSYRYTDLKKPDDTYLYLPSMRRVLRAEAGQRSTPILGGLQALDDFDGFDGRTSDFTFTFVRDQKVLANVNDKATPNIGRDWQPKGELWWKSEGWEPRDAYVIDIRPKDAKYPQGRKRIFLDKDSLSVLYSIAYDRAGKLWKVWNASRMVYSLPNGEKFSYMSGFFGVDLQFGMAGNFGLYPAINTGKITYNDATPASLLKRAR